MKPIFGLLSSPSSRFGKVETVTFENGAPPNDVT